MMLGQGSHFAIDRRICFRPKVAVGPPSCVPGAFYAPGALSLRIGFAIIILDSAGSHPEALLDRKRKPFFK